MRYRSSSYTANTWDIYWFEKNLQGDIVAVYDDAGTKLISYTYDAWGNFSTSYHNNGLSSPAKHNPFRYRGYYFDTDLGLYYLNCRYYDSVVSRFISSDGTDVISATPMGLTDKNLYAYCDNNPITRADNGGEFWHIVAGAAIGGLIGGISSIIGQAISGQKINWAEVGVSAASGALTGAITSACPGMG
jgi:RHS repeat-associated protein